MSGNENIDNILSGEVSANKPTTKQYKPRDPTYNNMYYHTKVAPVECELCGSKVVTRALYNHLQSTTCR
jgi:hypothetical protein